VLQVSGKLLVTYLVTGNLPVTYEDKLLV